MSDNQEKVWIIQRCIDAYKNQWEDWPEYSEPMTYDEMSRALKICSQHSEYEFRGHRLR